MTAAVAILVVAVIVAGTWAVTHDVDRPDLDPWMPPRRAVADVVGIGSVEVRSAAAVCPICGQSLEVIGS